MINFVHFFIVGFGHNVMHELPLIPMALGHDPHRVFLDWIQVIRTIPSTWFS